MPRNCQAPKRTAKKVVYSTHVLFMSSEANMILYPLCEEQTKIQLPFPRSSQMSLVCLYSNINSSHVSHYCSNFENVQTRVKFLCCCIGGDFLFSVFSQSCHIASKVLQIKHNSYGLLLWQLYVLFVLVLSESLG